MTFDFSQWDMDDEFFANGDDGAAATDFESGDANDCDF